MIFLASADILKGMEEAKDRLRIIRRELRLNQGEFAERIKISQSMLSGIEIGRETLTDRNIRLICLEFGVNEYWLRNGGPGPVFKESQPLAPDRERILEMYEQLNDENQRKIQIYAEDILFSQTFRAKAIRDFKAGLEGKHLETVEILDEEGQETPEN